MPITRRHALLALAASPVGCAIQQLSPVATQPMAAPGGAGAIRLPQAGQAWTYRKLNHFNSQVLAMVHETVASAGASGTTIHRREEGGLPLPHEQHGTWGQLLRDPVWDYPLNLEQAVPLWPANWAVGQQQVVHTHYLEDGGSFRYWVQVYAVVKGWERVTLPSGVFDTLRVERMLRLAHHDVNRSDTIRRDVIWLAPEVGRWVVRETSGRYREPDGDKPGGSEYLEDHFRWELTAWR